MEVRAIGRYNGLPASKMRLLVNMVRGKKVEEALSMLRFMPSPKAKVVTKLVRSAVANAENNFQVDPAELKIVKIFADDAPSLRRYRARSRGRASHIKKRSSHITVIVAD